LFTFAVASFPKQFFQKSSSVPSTLWNLETVCSKSRIIPEIVVEKIVKKLSQLQYWDRDTSEVDEYAQTWDEPSILR